MARFDVYKNLNRAARHAYYVDVQSDFVLLSTRWCIPLFLFSAPDPIVPRAHAIVDVEGRECVLDTPNMLAVPVQLLRSPAARLNRSGQLAAESCIEFMLRGY